MNLAAAILKAAGHGDGVVATRCSGRQSRGEGVKLSRLRELPRPAGSGVRPKTWRGVGLTMKMRIENFRFRFAGPTRRQHKRQ